MPVTGYTRVDDNDFEKLIPLAQTAASITPIKRYIDDGDIAAQINALQVAAGIPAAQRTNLLDRKDWEAKLVQLQSRINARTATVTIASPAVVSLATHGFLAGQAIKFSTTGALPTGIVAGTTYYVISTGLAAGTFQFAASPGGTAINTTGTQSGVHSVYTT
jgi:hypothetical protein